MKCRGLTLALTLAIATFAGALNLPAQDPMSPVDYYRMSSPPYRFTGLLRVESGNPSEPVIGTAVVAAEGVIVTAANLLYDTVAQQWRPPSAIRFYPLYRDWKEPWLPDGWLYFVPSGYVGWSEYYPYRIQTAEGEPGPDTYNVDFVALWFNNGIDHDLVTQAPPVIPDTPGETGILESALNKQLVGYTDLDSFDSWYLHASAPSPEVGFWEGVPGISDWDVEYEQLYQEQLWNGLYAIGGLTFHPHGSGSPLFVELFPDSWYLAGIAVGGKSSHDVFVRGIDEGAWQWVRTASFMRFFDGPEWSAGGLKPWVWQPELGWLYALGPDGADGLYGYLTRAGVEGHFYTSASLFPFLYRPQSRTWIYYVTGSGRGGQPALFYDFQAQDFIEAD